MRKMTFLILCSLFVSTSYLIARAPQTGDDSAQEKAGGKGPKYPTYATLWKITGKDLVKPSYFFGSLHSANPACTTLHPLAEKAFVASDAAFFEVDFAKNSGRSPIFRSDGKTLAQALGPDLVARTQFELQQISPKGAINQNINCDTLVCALMLPSMDPYSPAGGRVLDMALFEWAVRQNKTRGGLETKASQLRCLKIFNEKQKLAIYTGVIDNLKKARESGTPHYQNATTTYLLKKPATIESFLKIYDFPKHPKLSKALVKSLVDDRNITMVKKAKKLLEENPDKSHFFVVGAAHYTGKNALQDLLQKEGYTITSLFK